MKYMLLVYLEEDALTGAEREQCYVDSAKLAHDLHASGHFLDTSPLHPVSTVTSAETREQLGGYFLINARNLDEAIGIAGRIPAARVGTVEIRPVMEITGLPS